MKQFSSTVCVLLLAVVFYGVTAQDFVTKKEKKVSLNTLKEECGTLSGDVVMQCNKTIAACAALQERCIKNVECLLDGAKEDFFARADKAQCQAYLNKLNQAQEALEHATLVVREANEYLARLEKK